jgi:hypothetical protein
MGQEESQAASEGGEASPARHPNRNTYTNLCIRREWAFSSRGACALIPAWRGRRVMYGGSRNGWATPKERHRATGFSNKYLMPVARCLNSPEGHSLRKPL